MMRRITYCLALVAALAARVQAQTASINFNVPGPADWNVGSNWVYDGGTNIVPGDGFAEEVASIAGARSAFLAAAALFPIDGLVIASGTLEIRNNGALIVQEAPPSQFGGLGGTYVRGTSTLAIAGNGSLTTDLLRFEGGNLSQRLSGVNNTAIKVNDTAFLGGNLSVAFENFTPTIGQTWKIIDAPANQLLGEFTLLGTPGLPRGTLIRPTIDKASGDVSVEYDNALILSVDRRSGATSVSNVVGPSISIDGYTISSPSGQLEVAGWQSLDDKNTAPGFSEANPSGHRLSELAPIGSLSFAINQPIAIGSPFAGQSGPFGVPETADLQFSYFTPDGESKQGIVEYTGNHNNLVLLVDPDTGEAALQNQSTFTVDIDFYTITSASGSLNPAGWDSLDDQDVGVWAEANPTAIRLSELYPVAGSTFNPNKAYEIGEAFNIGGTQDLQLRFTFTDGTSINGIVEYREFDVVVGPLGDTNGDGKVDLTDLNNVRNNFGSTGLGDTNGDNNVDLTDLNNVRNNFGAQGSAAVPEPATFCLALLGLPFLVRRLRRK